MVGDNKWHVKPRMGEYILLNKNQGHQVRGSWYVVRSA